MLLRVLLATGALAATVQAAGPPALPTAAEKEDAAGLGEPAAAEPAPAPERVALAGKRPAPAREPAGPKPVPFDNHWLEPYFRSGGLKAAVERFRQDDWAAAVPALVKAINALPRNAPERQPARFVLGLARMDGGQWGEAGQIFEDQVESYPALAPWPAYYASRCRLRQGNTAAAINWARKVPARTVPEAEATLIVIDALGSERRWAEVEREAGSFLERFPAGPRRAEAMFRRAEAMENLGRPGREVAPLYRRIWAENPGDSWSQRADDRLTALARGAAAEDATQIRTRTAADWVERGMELFDRNANVDSENAFASALSAPGLDPALECKARYHRAQSVWKQRQRSRAVPFFREAEPACRKAGNSDLLVKSLYQGARCLASSGDKPSAVALYAIIEKEFPQHSYADDARLRAAEIASDAGDRAGAEDLLREIPARYPSGDQAGEALWRLAFAAWRAGDWETTQRWLDENLRLIPHEELWYAEGRAHYWKARVYEKLKQKDKARASYSAAVKEYPLSVYALLALERMRKTFPDTRAKLVRELRAPLGDQAVKDDGKASGWKFKPRPVFGEPGFRRAVEFARMGLGSEARRELARLGFAAPDSRDASRRAAVDPDRDQREDIYWITAFLLDRGRLWNVSHSIPRYSLMSYKQGYPASGRRATEWRIAFPRAFPEAVTRNSKLNQVPEALQLAIMREESAFSPRIESFANALGLTQLLVKTAQLYAPYRVTRDTLLDPNRNVELGSRYLSSLLKRFGGVAPLAIAGYNAGESAVERWLRDYSSLELDELMESIPFDETRNYTKRVLASYVTYSWLYFPSKPVPTINFAPPRPPTPPPRAGHTQPQRRR